ncbi:MAG: riboflavin synthase [Gammaproteobacteria bacterium]|jgi:riboflavin synthase
MFTGIIQSVGRIAGIDRRGADSRLHIETGKLDMTDVAVGDSIAVSGVCLTAVACDANSFAADVSAETLASSKLGDLGEGGRVNLEKALTPQTHLGGHLVSGHVDGVGEVLRRYDEGRAVRFELKAPDELARYIAAKGSITVDGVSLTVNEVNGARFMLNIVPHTLQETTLDELQSGSRVNLEVDIIARYLERLLLGEEAAKEGGITRSFLQQHGFI